MGVAEKVGVGASSGGASNIFDVFTTGEAPYTGIRARYGGADADWSARGVAIVPSVKSKALVPISGSMVNGWDITLKPSFISEEEEVNNWKVIRRERADAIAEIPAVAASLQWRVRGSGQTITITAAVAGAAGNNIGVKASRGTTRSTEYDVSRAGTRFDILWGTDGLSMSQLLREANAYYSRIVFSLNSGATGNSINLSLPSNGVGYAFMTGGADAIPAVPAEPISFGFDAVAKEITVSIKTTDTLAAIRGSNEFRTVFSTFAEVTIVGTVAEASATFAIPANDPGIAFTGGKNGNPLGIEIDRSLKIIDVRYDPSVHTLDNIFGAMQLAGVSPEYRGGGAAANTPEALGWVRSVGPLTAASPGAGTTVGSALSAAQIKQRYESNANTNAFTNALQTKLNGVDTGAADDQTGAEIKAAYEGEADTNVYTNDEKAKLGGVATGATAVSITNVLEKILEGTGVVIDRTTGGQITVASTGGVSLPVITLDTPTIEAAGLVFAAPAGYPAGGYKIGTLISFNINYYTNFVSSTISIKITIGADVYSFEGPNTNSVYYSSLSTDTTHLVVVKGSKSIQLLAPIKSAATAVTIVQVLAKIFAGTGININRAVGGQITITNTATGGGGGTADGVVNKAVFDEGTQTVTFTNSLGGTVTLNLGAFITATELTTALGPYTKADGTVAFTAAVAGVTPTDDAHLSTKKYVDDADVLKASLSGATFTGETSGLTPVNALNFTTKAYVDAAVAGTTPPAVRSELIYYGQILAANAADLAAAITYAETIDVSTLGMEDATVAGHNITVGPSANGDFFLILVPTTHDLLTLINLGTQADERAVYSRSENARNDLGTPSEQYNSYVVGPLNPGVSIGYRLTLTE